MEEKTSNKKKRRFFKDEEMTPLKIIGKLFKCFMAVLIISIYLFFFVRIFVSCDADVVDEVYLSQEMAEIYDNRSEEFTVLLYEPVSWTNDDGSLQIKNIIYIPRAENLHIAIKYNTKKFDTEPSRFVLRKTTGDGENAVETVYNVSKYVEEQRYNYGYIRLCYEDVTVYDGEIIEKEVEKYDEQLDIFYTEIVKSIEGGDKVYLDIYDENGELLYTFTVAGKTIGGRKISRDKVDVVIK